MSVLTVSTLASILMTETIDEGTGEVLSPTQMSETRLVLSQSLIKKLDQDNLCPRYYYLYHLSGQYKEPSSEAMVKGQRFEWLAVGSKNREGYVPEIPKLKNGAKSTDEVRIEAQAEVFQQVLPHYNMRLLTPEGQECPSVALELPHGEDILLTGILDAIIIWNGQPAIMDLKLTASLVSRWGPNGKPGWGDYFNMDHIQAYLYMYLVEKIFKRKMRFVYALFEYGPEPKFKFIEIKDTSMRRAEMLRRVDDAREKVAAMAEQNYPPQGHYLQCAKCAEKHTCPARRLVPEIETFD